MADLLTPKDVSVRLGLKPDGKALRRFMRKLADGQMAEAGADAVRVARVGQGNRYALSAADARFIETAWRKAHGIAEPKPKTKRAPKAAHAPQAEQAETAAPETSEA